MTESWEGDPTLVPEFYEEQDGCYYHRVVIEDVPAASYAEDDQIPLTLGARIEPLSEPLPRYATRMRWVAGWWGS